jgi:hypothetical protein
VAGRGQLGLGRPRQGGSPIYADTRYCHLLEQVGGGHGVVRVPGEGGLEGRIGEGVTERLDRLQTAVLRKTELPVIPRCSWVEMKPGLASAGRHPRPTQPGGRRCLGRHGGGAHQDDRTGL